MCGCPFGHLPHQVNAAVARCRGAFEFPFNHFRRTQVRHDRQGHVTVAGPVPLGQRVIVCAHHVQFELDIAKLENDPPGGLGNSTSASTPSASSIASRACGS